MTRPLLAVVNLLVVHAYNAHEQVAALSAKREPRSNGESTHRQPYTTFAAKAQAQIRVALPAHPEGPSVAWLTEAQADPRSRLGAEAPVTYVYPDALEANAVAEERVSLVVPRPASDIQCLSPNKVLATDDWCGQLCASNFTSNQKVGNWRRKNKAAHQMAKVARRSSALTAAPSGGSELPGWELPPGQSPGYAGFHTLLAARRRSIRISEFEPLDLREAQRTPPLEGQCDPDFCECFDASISREELVKNAKTTERKQPSGLPDCPWIAPEGCTQDMPYECMDGEKAGECSDKNWFGRSDLAVHEGGECTSSCIHTKLFFYSPACEISATCESWTQGPKLAPPPKGEKETFPHYEHDPSKLTLEKRGIDASELKVMMSPACKKHKNDFVGITFYSPAYKFKAERLLKSCGRHDICCKATEAPDTFGPNAPEGSEAFRFQFIAIKPSFILGQMEATRKPVVWLDSDLEFHRYPKLFAPGGWSDGPRDVAIFNYWGNESNGQNTPSTGSGVVYFNNTERARALVGAWAEAMAYGTNPEAPDDQVFNELLGPGGWVRRASFGWLPAAYLRVMPMFYRGVDPVIDHDHGNPPGLIEHSPTKPVMPPVGGPIKGSAVVSGQGGMENAEGKNPWETGEAGHWGEDGEWVSEVGDAAGGQAAAAPEVAVQVAPEEAPPPAEVPAEVKPALSCEATSPQASADWCVTSCGENPDNAGCVQFCKCETLEASGVGLAQFVHTIF
tara:strand:- start:548 stop:2749 length:2202 start_codon:yes stop_codon:yes gene_type:complete